MEEAAGKGGCCPVMEMRAQRTKIQESVPVSTSKEEKGDERAAC